jgi:hypothetical protein
LDAPRRLGEGEQNNEEEVLVRTSFHLLVVLMAVGIDSIAGDQLSPATRQFMASDIDQSVQEASSLTSAEKFRRIEELRGAAVRNPAGKEDYQDARALLGDEEALKQLVREFLDNDGAGPGFLARIRNPRIIELAAPELFREEPMKLTGGDVVIIPRSYRVAELAVDLMQDSPAFNADVINWARSLRGLTFTELREIIRPWWKENEQHFREKNYQAVQPGPPAPRDAMARIEGRAAQAPPLPQAESSTQPPSVPAPLVRAPTTSRTDNSSGWLWRGAVAALALSAALLLFRQRRP